jgi:hypothetical protein
MKELKQHLQEMHKSNAAHHAEAARAMTSLADQHHALAKHLEMTDPTGSASHKAAEEACKSAAACHVAHAEKCLAMHKSAGELPDTPGGPAEKVATGEAATLLAGIQKLLNTAMPTNVSVFPTTDRPQAIPRYGARNVPSDEACKAVAPELRDIILPEERETPAAAIRPGRTD